MTFISMFIYMLIMMFTPGPNNLTMLFLGARYGIKGTRKFLIASAACLLIKSLLCGLLNLGLAELMPVIIGYMKWAGAAYMLYLGIVMARSGWKEETSLAGQQEESTYLSGVLLQLLNMKSWIACISLFAVYVIPFTKSVFTITWVSALFLGIMIVASLCWGLFGSAMRKFINRYKKPFGIVMGLSLLYCAVTAVL
ncbi:MAG: LysE family transporter [Clostridia bacterium]|nr:LysE family transporter [Clostridia bacterium]